MYQPTLSISHTHPIFSINTEYFTYASHFFLFLFQPRYLSLMQGGATVSAPRLRSIIPQRLPSSRGIFSASLSTAQGEPHGLTGTPSLLAGTLTSSRLKNTCGNRCSSTILRKRKRETTVPSPTCRPRRLDGSIQTASTGKLPSTCRISGCSPRSPPTRD